MSNDDWMVDVSVERQSLRHANHSIVMQSISPNEGNNGGDKSNITPPSPQRGTHDGVGDIASNTPSSHQEEDHAFTTSSVQHHSLLLQECPTPIKKQRTWSKDDEGRLLQQQRRQMYNSPSSSSSSSKSSYGTTLTPSSVSSRRVSLDQAKYSVPTLKEEEGHNMPAAALDVPRTTMGDDSPFTPIGRRMMNELSINSPQSLYPMQHHQLSTPTRSKQPAYGSPPWSSVGGRNYMTPISRYQRSSSSVFKPLHHSFGSPFVVAAKRSSEGNMSTLNDSSHHSSSSLTSITPLTLDRSYSSLWVPLTVLTKEGSSLGVALPSLTSRTSLRSIDVDGDKNKKLETTTTMTAHMVTTEPQRRILPPKIRPRMKSPPRLFDNTSGNKPPPLLEVDIGLQLDELSNSLHDGYNSDHNIKAEQHYHHSDMKEDEELGRESEDAEIMALLTQYIPTLDDTTFSYSPSDDRSSTKRPMPTITLHHKQQHGGETSEHDTRAVAATATKRRSPSFLPCPIPIRQPGTSRSMLNRTIKNDPIESIILADAIAEAAKCEHSLTDDEASHHSDFLLSLPSDATTTAAEQQQNIIPRRTTTTVGALQNERRKRFSFKPRSTPPLDDDVEDQHVTSLAVVGANNSTLFSFGTPPISSSSHNLLKSHESNWGDEMMKLSHKLTNFDSNVMQFEGSSSDSSDNDNNNDIIQSPSPPSSLLLFDRKSNKSTTTMLAKSNNNLNSSPGVLLNDWTTTTPAGVYQQEIFSTPPTTMI